LVHYPSGEAFFAVGVNYPLKVAGFDPALPGWFYPARDSYDFDLIPVGTAVIPILTISATTVDGTAISSLVPTGPTLPIMATTHVSPSGDASAIEYRTLNPGPIHVTVMTVKKPIKINFGITPITTESLTRP
jgi:hypothetical protein